MMLTLSLLTVLLEARLAIGSPVVIGEPELVERQGPPPSTSSCIFQFAPGLIIIPVGIPPQPADPLGFCSEFIQSSTTVIKTSSFTSTATVTRATTIPVTTTSTRLVTSVVTLTSLGTQTLTRTSITSKPRPTTPTTSPTTSPPVITTTSAPTPTTTGALCPTPVADQTCGLGGWGYATNNIYSGSLIDAPACHQLCLSKTECKSFQVLANSTDPVPQCNLYNVPAGGNNTIPGTASPYVFYDRGCPDFSPSTCKLNKRDTRVPTPWYFSGIPTETLSDICSCMVTKPLPTAVATQTVSRVVTSTTAVLVPTTQTFAITTTAATVSTTVVTRITTVYATQTVTVGSFGMVARGA